MRPLMEECPVCHVPVEGYCCAKCGYIPLSPDSTGDTGEDDDWPGEE